MLAETEISIMTVPAFKRAIREASEVLAQVRFGTSEQWVRISKAGAMELIKGLPASATPEEAEIYSGQFGAVIGSTLYIG